MSFFGEGSRIDVIGVPFGAGGCIGGVELGPAALRAAGLVNCLRGIGFEVRDLGDVVTSEKFPVEVSGMNNAAEVAGIVRALSDRAYHSAKCGAMPLVLGGDHSISMGSINGVARRCKELNKELFVLWLDAHSDFNTPSTSPTGNAHGMSAAFVCGERGMDDLLGGISRVAVDPLNLYAFGVRWMDPAEQLLAASRHVNVLDMREVDRKGVVSSVEGLIDRVRKRSGVLHVSFDLDALDPGIAPGVGTPEAGGFGLREAHLIMQLLADSGLVVSIDLVEVNPLLDHGNSGAKLMVELMSTLLGRRIFDVREDSPARSSLLVARYGDSPPSGKPEIGRTPDESPVCAGRTAYHSQDATLR